MYEINVYKDNNSLYIMVALYVKESCLLKKYVIKTWYPLSWSLTQYLTNALKDLERTLVLL